jgi:hypothetical protein
VPLLLLTAASSIEATIILLDGGMRGGLNDGNVKITVGISATAAVLHVIRLVTDK